MHDAISLAKAGDASMTSANTTNATVNYLAKSIPNPFHDEHRRLKGHNKHQQHQLYAKRRCEMQQSSDLRIRLMDVMAIIVRG